MAYTPSTAFIFNGGVNYTPPTSFSFSDEPPPEVLSGAFSGTLNSVTGSFAGRSFQNSGQISGTLEGPSGGFVGYIPVRGSILSLLDGATGSFSGTVPPLGEFSGELAGATGFFIGRNVTNLGHFSAALSGVAGSFDGLYDPNVQRFTVGRVCAIQDDSHGLPVSQRLTRFQAGLATSVAHAVRQAAGPLVAETRMRVDATAPVRIHACAPADTGEPITLQTAGELQQMTPVESVHCSAIGSASRLTSEVFAELYHLELIYTDSRHPVEDTGQTVHTFLRRIYGEPPEAFRYPPGTTAFVFPETDYTPTSSFTWPYMVPATDLVTNQQRAGIRHEIFSYRQRATRHKRHQCETVQDARRPPPGISLWIDPPRPPPVEPPGHTTINIPSQAAYIMNHSLSVTLLDLTPIPMASVRLSYDADAFAWQFSGQLADKAALPLVRQQSGQPPVQLIVTINGYSWNVLVERIGRGHEFAKNSITLSGRGLTALLGQPYEQPASATQGSALTVQQLADLHLPPGWTINWTCSTWLVPASAYSYSNQTPIQALAATAKDIGAMLVPARDSQTIGIMPRYPVLPWDYALAPPDVTVPEAAIIAVSEQTVAPSQANAVYVHGGEIGGVLAWCRLNGTAGDRLAPSVSNALLTDVTGCRALGERILAGQYEQPGIQSITLPMDGDTVPLLSVGQLAEITVDASPVRGIVNAVSIEATLASVRQTIQIGEETPNQWTLFKDLLPRDPLLVATLAETDGTTSLMTLLDGGVVRVRGTGTVGNKYYIRAGKIDGEAPNMAQNEVVI